MPSTVLVITNELDAHADAVVLELHKRNVPVFRFHPEDFPHACSISIEIQNGRIEGEIINKYHRAAFSDICGAWFRRSHTLLAPGPSLASITLDNYVKGQTMLTVTTLCEAIQTLWVCHPHAIRRASVKALQLAEASKAGLKTPDTLISNDPAKVAAFVGSLGDTECAVKALVALGVSDEQGYRLPFTTTLPRDHSLESVALAPTMFQPYIAKAADLRCVVIGQKIFCARINSQANQKARKDWRAAGSKNCQHEIFALPEHVEASIHRLMDSLGIKFASMDMVLTPEGEIVFLEANPTGQWLWIEERLGFPLVASMADLLTTYYSREGQGNGDERESSQQRGVYAS